MPSAALSTDERPQALETTFDALFEGSLPFYQPARGYRLNIDTLLLAHFAATGLSGALAAPDEPFQKPRLRTVVDLGAGVGGASLILARHVTIHQAILVDQNPALLALAAQNLALSSLRGSVLEADLSEGCPAEIVAQASLVISNPPFFDADDPTASPGPARSARNGHLSPFLSAAAQCLASTKSRALFVYPAQSLVAFLDCASRSGLVPKRLQFVHPRHDEPARVALVELRRARPGGLTICPPLMEWTAPGIRSPELARIIAGPKLAKGPSSSGRPASPASPTEDSASNDSTADLSDPCSG